MFAQIQQRVLIYKHNRLCWRISSVLVSEEPFPKRVQQTFAHLAGRGLLDGRSEQLPPPPPRSVAPAGLEPSLREGPPSWGCGKMEGVEAGPVLHPNAARQCCVSILQRERPDGNTRPRRPAVTARRWGGGCPRPTRAPHGTSSSCGLQCCRSCASLHTFHVFDC